MTVFNRVLVAIDDTSTSTAALSEAIRIAKDQQSALRIALVVDVVTLDAESSQQLIEFEDSVRKAGDRVLQKAAAEARKAGIEAETMRLEVQTLQDHVADALVRQAEAWRADLIVIGTHGRHGLSRLFIGSVAESVARSAPVPVLLVRDLAGYK